MAIELIDSLWTTHRVKGAIAVTKILTIEDEPDVREIILDILEAEGYEVAGAADGNAGVRLAEAFQPDLILCICV